MKNPFRRTVPAAPAAADAEDTAYSPKNPQLSADGWDPKPMRDVVFKTLAVRVGQANAEELRADFDHHLDEDPINGAEAGWICLTGKLIETLDRFNDALSGAPAGVAGGDEPVSPFTTFRKDG